LSQNKSLTLKLLNVKAYHNQLCNVLFIVMFQISISKVGGVHVGTI